MNLFSLHNLRFRTKLSLVAAIFLVLGLVGAVFISQQNQENRSHASGTCPNYANMYDNDCTVNGDFYGNILGSRNTITGNMTGNIDNTTATGNLIMINMTGNIVGDGNEVCGNMFGNLTGNNNIIHGTFYGNNTGQGNIIQSSADCGVVRLTPTPTITQPNPTPTTPPNGNCTDGIDNNQNELIDAGDPACHTDGDQNNPGSFDPSRNEGAIITTPIPTVTCQPNGVDGGVGGCVTPTVAPLSRCSDNIDNDNNGFKDNLDSACHTDGNPRNPNSYDPNRDGEHGNGNTCADSRDNNSNNLIDGGDPICHTDGNANNPNSYDSSRPESQVTPTDSCINGVGFCPITPTVSVNPGNTSVFLKLLLHGLGQAGDSANPGSGGNPNPLHPQRNAVVEIYNSQNALVLTKNGFVTFDSGKGEFRGMIDLGSALTTGSYIVKVKTNQFLRTLVPGIQNITAGQSNQLSTTTMVNGDINSDNTLNILDYNILMGCYSDFLPATSCTAANKLQADIDDDGDVNQFDYNLFLRELANRQGQ